MNAIDILNEQVPPSSTEQWATETAMAMAFGLRAKDGMQIMGDFGFATKKIL